MVVIKHYSKPGTDILRLKDNGSSDNLGNVSFVLDGGVNPDIEILSDSLPIYDGEFYSVMLTRMVQVLVTKEIIIVVVLQDN